MQLDAQGQSCIWGNVAFLALVRTAISPTGPEDRGPTQQEHDLVLTTLRGNLPYLPAPGADILIGDSGHFPVAFVNACPGGTHIEIVCRQS